MITQRPGTRPDRVPFALTTMEEHPVDLAAALRRHRLLAIVRGGDPDAVVASVHTLAEAGVRVIEISLTSAGALTAIATARAEVGEGVHLGAGTVLTEDDVAAVHAAGGSFVVTPGLAPPALAAARRYQLPALVGALTPSEVVAAAGAGAAAVKLFPASLGGPGYLRALRDPFPDTAFVPVGGVDAAAAPEYLAAGAIAVGVGSPLLGDAVAGGDASALRVRAARFLEAVA